MQLSCHIAKCLYAQGFALIGSDGSEVPVKKSVSHAAIQWFYPQVLEVGHGHKPPSPTFFRRFHLDKRQILLAAALTALVATPAVGAEGGREKCYGIAKAGRNDCASLTGSHSCAGQATSDKNRVDWKFVAKGTCKQAGGMSADEAKRGMK